MLTQTYTFRDLPKAIRENLDDRRNVYLRGIQYLGFGRGIILTHTEIDMKYFTAECYQALNGRYLSLEENNASRVKIMAIDEEEAFEKLAEIQIEDSELTVQERWNVFETTKYNFENNHLPVIR